MSNFHTVRYDVYDIADPVCLEVGRQRDHTLFLEIPGEAVSTLVTIGAERNSEVTHA